METVETPEGGVREHTSFGFMVTLEASTLITGTERRSIFPGYSYLLESVELAGSPEDRTLLCPRHQRQYYASYCKPEIIVPYAIEGGASTHLQTSTKPGSR